MNGLRVKIEVHVFFVELRDTAHNGAAVFFSGHVGVFIVFVDRESFYPLRVIGGHPNALEPCVFR